MKNSLGKKVLNSKQMINIEETDGDITLKIKIIECNEIKEYIIKVEIENIEKKNTTFTLYEITNEGEDEI